MEPIRQFFTSFATDVAVLIKGEDRDPDTRMQRVIAVAARVLGALMLVAAASTFITEIALLHSPIAIVVEVIGAIFFSILALDFLRVGHNVSRHLGDIRGDQGIVGGLLGLGGRVYNEVVRNTPYPIHDTIIFEPVYRLIHAT